MDKLLPKTISDAIPTNDELRAFIEKVAEFLSKFVELFDRLKDGLAETFGEYRSQFEA
jgi:hypothetical protein